MQLQQAHQPGALLDRLGASAAPFCKSGLDLLDLNRPQIDARKARQPTAPNLDPLAAEIVDADADLGTGIQSIQNKLELRHVR